MAKSKSGKLATETPPAKPDLHLKIPIKSVANAKSVFKNFTLSKYSDKAAAPENFAPSDTKVSAVQERGQVNHLKSIDASGRFLRLALSDDNIKTMLPSFNGKSIDLSELMTLVQKAMRGTEYYTTGNATLSRLSVKAAVNDIIEAIKNGSEDQPIK